MNHARDRSRQRLVLLLRRRGGGRLRSGRMIISRIDSSTGVAAAVLQVPTVVDFGPDEDPCALIATGDRVRVDGETGVVPARLTNGARCLYSLPM